MKLKTLIKKCLGFTESHIKEKEDNYDNIPTALNLFLKENPEYKEEIHTLGKRCDGKEFSKDIKKITDGFVVLNTDLKKLDNKDIPDIFEYDGLHSGTPMKYKPFKKALRNVRLSTLRSNLYWYPNASGSSQDRQKIVDYLLKEDMVESKSIGINNVIFSYSTTHAFHLIIKNICKPNDVVIVTGPNYGLFAVKPENIGKTVEVLPLYEEDNFLPNPLSLDKLIKSINKRLQEEYKDSDYIPRVKAFLNENPHNPLGSVLTEDNITLLDNISKVCSDNGVFIIDDLIYRDLSYDKKAYPLMKNSKYFDNTITIMGISKAYGLASLRAGFIVGPTPLIRKINTTIEEEMDSMSILQIAAITGIFNGNTKSLNKYLDKLLKQYKYRYQLLTALIYGIDYIKNEDIKHKIIKDIKRYTNDLEKTNYILKGIDKLSIRKGTIPKSGFFAILDFTKYKGCKYNNKVINNDMDFIKYLYSKTKIKIIMGSNMSWPYEDEIVGRINFSLEKKALINDFYIMKKALEELK